MPRAVAMIVLSVWRATFGSAVVPDVEKSQRTGGSSSATGAGGSAATSPSGSSLSEVSTSGVPPFSSVRARAIASKSNPRQTDGTMKSLAPAARVT